MSSQIYPTMVYIPRFLFKTIVKAIPILQRTEFESCWGLQFFCNTDVWKMQKEASFFKKTFIFLFTFVLFKLYLYRLTSTLYKLVLSVKKESMLTIRRPTPRSKVWLNCLDTKSLNITMNWVFFNGPTLVSFLVIFSHFKHNFKQKILYVSAGFKLGSLE